MPTKLTIGRAALVALLFFVPLSANGNTGILDRMREQAAIDAEQRTTEPLEINNIHDSRVALSQPGLVSYVVFLGRRSGRPIGYSLVRGHCTSSNKRLTSGETGVILEDGRRGKHIRYREEPMAAPSEDGTYGSSSRYIYCFAPDGRYIQWNGRYYYSNRPIELSTRPVMVTGQFVEEHHAN